MITPSDTPSSPENYAGVPVQEMNIQAPAPDVSGALSQANADAGAGVLYPQSTRQSETRQLLESPAGFASDGFDIDAGSAFGWPNNVEPGG
jgi:hypothetical protein